MDDNLEGSPRDELARDDLGEPTDEEDDVRVQRVEDFESDDSEGNYQSMPRDEQQEQGKTGNAAGMLSPAEQSQIGAVAKNRPAGKEQSQQNQKVFEILYTTPEAAVRQRGGSPEAVGEFLGNVVGKDVMTTPQMPIMDSPQPGLLNTQGASPQIGDGVDDGAHSARSPRTTGTRRGPDDFGGSASTPASAEEQLEIFKRASRFRSLHGAKKTQVHAKVDFVFFWVDRNPGDTPKAVEVMGDFSNWKPVPMKRIDEIGDEEEGGLDEPPLLDGTPPTHFLRRDVDPKSQQFIFRVDGGGELETTDLYSSVLNNGQRVNVVDLENTPTRLVVEKNNRSHKKSKAESTSQYTTFSGYLENE